MPEPSFHFSGLRNSAEWGFSIYVVGSISSIITKPMLRTSSCLFSAVVDMFRTKDSPMLAYIY
jgi:hypothetical protein